MSETEIYISPAKGDTFVPIKIGDTYVDSHIDPENKTLTKTNYKIIRDPATGQIQRIRHGVEVIYYSDHHWDDDDDEENWEDIYAEIIYEDGVLKSAKFYDTCGNLTGETTY